MTTNIERVESLVAIIKNELEKFSEPVNGKVFLAIEERDTPPLNKGLMVDVSYRIKDRRYNAFLFRFFKDFDKGVVNIIWGEEEFEESNPEKVRSRINSIITYQTVLTSRDQLLELCNDSSKKGVVKTIDYSTVAANDFEVELNSSEYETFEDQYQKVDSFTINATEPKVTPYAGRFVEQIKQRYKYLEINGWRAEIQHIEKQDGNLVLTLINVHI